MGLRSFLGSVGSGIKNGVVGAGHAVGSVASNPWVQGLTAAGLAATGVGAPAAAGIMAAQRGGGALLRPGGNIGDAARGGAEGAAMGAGAARAGGLLRGAMAARGAAGAGGGVPGDGAASESGGMDWGNLLRGGGSFLKDRLGQIAGGTIGGGAGGGGGINPLVLGLAGAQVANAGNLGNKANEYSGKAFDLASDSYNARAPLRSAGIGALPSAANPSGSGLLAARPMQDTSGLTALRMQNPVAARAAHPAGPAGNFLRPPSVAS